ncbi:oligosaccharide flippase family protein [uncultured Croceitalea sp.]|uniref:lipopolysaccharide biosynthesis protein n=1 Tax=uncultured Croceitalea sp. TaxID=1798908 RepID=UPI0033065E7D
MKKAIFSVSAFNFLSAGLAFLLNIFLARFFSVEIYGRINLLLSFTLIINTVLDFGFSNTNVIFYNKNIVKNSKEDVLGVQFLFYRKLLPWLFLLGFFLIWIFNIFFNLSKLEFFFLVFQGIVISFFRYSLSFEQAFGNWARFNLLNLSLNLIKVLFLGSVFIISLSVKDENLLTYDIALLLLSLACLVSFFLALKGLISLKDFFFITEQKEQLKTGFKKIWKPLIGINLIIVFAMRFDTLIIQEFLGETQLGIFSAANSLALVFPLITNSLIQVLLKETASKGTEYLRKLLKFQKKILPILLFLIVLVELMSYYLIPFVFGESYDKSIAYFQILVIAHLGGLFFTPLESFFYSKESKIIFFLKGLQLSIIVILSLVLIQFFGLFGVVSAILISRVAGWIFLMRKSFLEIKNNIDV